MRIARDIGLLVVALSLLAVALLAYRDDRAGRDAVEKFVAAFDLELRRPDDVATMRVQPQADLEAVIAASMTLEDIYGSVRLKELDGPTRAAWIRAVSRTSEQLDTALELSLDATARRPGGAYHHEMLAQLSYSKSRRASLDAVVRDIDRWELPAIAAISLAPGNESMGAFLGGAYVDIWKRTATRVAPEVALRGAMRSARFVDRYYRTVAAITGPARTIELLPDDPAVLRIALGRDLREAHVESAATLRTRLDATIRERRARDLARIEQLAARRDIWGLQSALPAWVAAYRLDELDTAADRAELAKIAELWPDARRGAWASDPRGALLRHLLDGRVASVDGPALARLSAGLFGVPEPVAARALALGGEPSQAQDMLRASQTRGAFEWTPAIVEIARAFLRRGDATAVSNVLEDLAPAARGECEALLVIRDATKSAAEREELSRRLAERLPAVIPATSWSRSGSLPLCIDPRVGRNAVLRVAVDASRPALVSWGWDRGRAGTLLISGATTLHVPLGGLEGRRTLGVRLETGGPITVGDSLIEKK